MDDIEKRLRDASDHCFKCYESWSKNQKDGKVREEMLDSIHELRKVAARLEIEMAVSERNEMASKPIPIPSHRASRKNQNQQQGDDSIGNMKDDRGGGEAGGNDRPNNNKNPRGGKRKSSK